MIHALTLLGIVLFAAPLARFIPLSVLAAILPVVSCNMGEWREIPELLKQSRFEIVAWLVTFLLTVFADLTVAVEAGMILAVLVFIRKVTQTTTVSEATTEYIREGHVHIQALENFADRVHESGRQRILCGAREQPATRMHGAEFHEHLGPENFCRSVAEALDRAKILYPEVALQLPSGNAWGRRRTDSSLAMPAVTASSGPES